MPALSTSSGMPRVAVAFGGGGARGIAHIQVIEALDEMGVVPVAISGASIGAIMGAGMASRLPGAFIREHTLSTVGKPKDVMRRLWALRPVSMRGWRLGQYNLERILRAFLPDAIPERFGDLAIPLKISVTDYYNQQETVLETGDLYQAIAASAAIPAIFMPVMLDGRVTLDGGISNPVPYEQLFDLADIVIGVDVVGAPEGDGTHMPNRIDSLFGSGQLMMQSLIAMKLRLRAPHIFIRPPVNAFRVLDFLKARDILAASESVRDDLKRALSTEIERQLRG